MKLKLVALLALFSSAMLLASEGAPKIEFTKLEHDFGEIEKSGTVTHKFQFKNAGDGSLEIMSVKPSCGCTSATPEQKMYAPGEDGQIPVTFDPSRFSGNIVKTIRVTSNDPERPEVKLVIRGKIVEDVVVKPANLFMNNVRRDSQETREVLVSTDRMDKLEISDLKVEPEYFSVKMEKVDDKNAKLLVTADGAKFPEGKRRVSGLLTYTTNSESAQKNMRTSITVNVLNPIMIRPRSTLYFYGVSEGQAREQTLQVEATDGTALELTDVKSDLDFIKVEVLPGQDARRSLKVTLSDKAPTGKFSGKVTMKTNLKSQSEITIPIRGAVQ